MRTEEEIRNEMKKLDKEMYSLPYTSVFEQERGDLFLQIATLNWVLNEDRE